MSNDRKSHCNLGEWRVISSRHPGRMRVWLGDPMSLAVVVSIEEDVREWSKH